jgi:hypothetical protein
LSSLIYVEYLVIDQPKSNMFGSKKKLSISCQIKEESDSYLFVLSKEQEFTIKITKCYESDRPPVNIYVNDVFLGKTETTNKLKNLPFVEMATELKTKLEPGEHIVTVERANLTERGICAGCTKVVIVELDITFNLISSLVKEDFNFRVPS